MKEIGKLIELLNEFLVQRASGYIHYHSGGEFKRTPTKSAVEGDRMLQDEYVLGKSFGWIKWLVENDKIDESKIFCDQGLYYSLLCKLAISDTPIEDLLLYLK